MSSAVVSILIPCRNAAPWLGATLEAALAQTWPAVEIIVVDDGSTDASLALARSYESRGVRVYSQPQAGASAARNRAVRESTGKFLQYLDADDLISPDKISAQMNRLARLLPGRVGTCRWGRFLQDPATARFVDDEVFRDFVPVDFLVTTAQTGAMMHPSAWLVPRTVAERAGPWNEALSLNDDGEYFARVALASSGLAYASDDSARSYYRSGLPGSLSRQRGDAARRSQFRSIELITQHLLAAEKSPRTRRACAAGWRRFVHDFYPSPAELMERAEREIEKLGELLGAPSASGKTGWLARLVGWKNAWRIKHLLRP